MEIFCPHCTSILLIKEKLNTVMCSICYNDFTIEIDLMEDVFEANKKELNSSNYIPMPRTMAIPKENI